MRLGLFSQSVVLGFESDNGRQRRKSRQTGHFFLIEQASKIDPPKVWKSSAWKGWFYGPGVTPAGDVYIYIYIYIYKYYNNVVHKFIVIFGTRFIFVIFGTCILNGKKGWKTLNIYVKAVFVLSPSDFVLLKNTNVFWFWLGWLYFSYFCCCI